MKRKITLLAFVMLFGFSMSFAQSRKADPQIQKKKEQLLKLAQEFKQEYNVRKAEAVRIANEKGWAITETTSDSGLMEIQYIDESGMPQYYVTTNLNAARTVNTDDLWTGGSSGLNLDGTGFLIGEWDGGGVLTTHQEFDNGSGTRVTQMDSPSSTHWHSTHVAGTMIAEGQVGAAHGMAPNADLNAYDWNNDLSEMATAASNGLTISNHSYGWNRGWVYNSTNGLWYWYGNPSISATEDYLFGFYDSNSHDLDNVAFNAPEYLVVKSAGNDRNDDHSGGHYYWNGSSWTYSTAYRDPDGGASGYDCLGQNAVAKNVLTVGAVNDIPGGWTQPSDVVMSSFSSWGPTDDGRIKPDIVANGVNLYSCTNSGNSNYTYSDGTSMSSPSVTGTLALLQDYYQSLRGGQMRAAALKGLVINTANEAGPADGPDYMNGWGLLNATGATDLITNDNTDGGLIVEGILLNGQTTEYTYYCDGTSDINVTVSWTDPPGTPVAASLDPTNLMLVNNLDLQLIKGGVTYRPWVLNPAFPSNNAYKGINYRDNVETVNIHNPVAGYYTIRINHGGTLTNGQQAYALIIKGLSTPHSQTYCQARTTVWNSYEYISKVTIGSIDNTSDRSPGGYSDYSGQVVNINKGGSESITVTLTNPYSNDLANAWADWNHDGDFDDAGEEFVLGSGSGPYNATITVPSDAISGYTTLRVRMVYNTTPNSCGVSTYGETEDYSIFVVGTPGLWTGLVNSDWHEAGNWDDLTVPTSSVDVTIPGGTPNDPVITGSVYCKNLTVTGGATLTQNGTSYFHVYGDFNTDFGTFTQNGLSYLYFNGSASTVWDDDNEDDTYTYVRVDKTTNSAQHIMWQDMTVANNFEIREGIFKIDNQWTLTVSGSANSYLNVEDGGTLTLVDESVNVSGDIIFDDGSKVDVTGGAIYCGGDFKVYANATYDITLSGGKVEMNGTFSQYIDDQDGGALEFYNLVINKPGGICYIKSADLNVSGDINIASGTLSCANGSSPTNHYDIYIKKNWQNSVGDAGFDETGGRVVFNGGNYHQYCTSEHFDTLEIAKVSGGAFRPFSGAAYNIVCEHYDWTAGAIDIIPGGSSFTANDLIDNGIYGGFWLNSGGTINLTNNDGYVDLDGDLHIFGGTMNVYGGTSDSYWPFLNDASIEMSDGVLDFHNRGIYIYNSTTHTLTENITGGTIRTTGGYRGNRADFTPSAGTFEFYGSLDYTISQANGSTLYDVNIDKGSKSAASGTQGNPVIDERSKTMMSDGGKSNTNTLNSDFVITNNLTVTSGGLTLSGHTLSVAHSCGVAGTLTMDNAADILNVGTVQYDMLTFLDGSVGNITNGVINLPYALWLDSGSSFIASTGNTIYFGNTLDFGGIYNGSGNTLFGNITVDMLPGDKWILDNFSTDPFVVTGDFTVMPNNVVEMNDQILVINGNLSDVSSSAIYVYDGPVKGKSKNSLLKDPEGQGSTKSKGGYLEIDNDFTLNGLMDLGTDGTVLAHGHFESSASGVLTISGGSLTCDVTDGISDLYGIYNISDGLLEYTDSHIGYYGTPNITGGLLRAGRTVFTSDDGLQANGGTFEFIGSKNGNYIQPGANTYLNDLVFNKTSSYIIYPQNTANPLVVKGNVTINSGVFSSNGNDMFVGGNWINNVGSSAFNETTGTVTFNEAGDVTVTGETFYNLTLSKPGSGEWLTLTDDVTVLNDLTINGGALHTSSNILDVNGNASVNAGTLFVQAGGTLKIGDNKTLTTAIGSNLYIEGASSNYATLTHSGTGHYNTELHGEIAANYALFEYMGANGIYVANNGTINPVYTFNHCIFQNGYEGFAGLSAYLRLDNINTFTSVGTYFGSPTADLTYNVWKTVDAGHATFQAATGEFAGAEFENDWAGRVDWTDVDVEVSLNVMLEGPYNGTDMNTDLNNLGLIPLNQPFSSNPYADWYYTGTESVAAIPANVVDWVLVQLRDAGDATSADEGTVVTEQAAFLLNDGSIVDLDGSSNLYFPGITYSSGLFPVVWHRNHLGIISANKMTRTGGVYTYDFTQAGSAYSNSSAGEKNLGGSVWGMFSGDASGGGALNTYDISFWNNNAGRQGYYPGDFNLDSQVENMDKNDFCVDNFGNESQIPGSKGNDN